MKKKFQFLFHFFFPAQTETNAQRQKTRSCVASEGSARTSTGVTGAIARKDSAIMATMPQSARVGARAVVLSSLNCVLCPGLCRGCRRGTVLLPSLDSFLAYTTHERHDEISNGPCRPWTSLFFFFLFPSIQKLTAAFSMWTRVLHRWGWDCLASLQSGKPKKKKTF